MQHRRRQLAEVAAVFHRESSELNEARFERTLLNRVMLRVAFAQEAAGFLEAAGF
jgi:hypothetical protein